MKRIFSSKRDRFLTRASIFLLAVALITGMAGCDVQPVHYNLMIDSTSGGAVIYPGEGTFVYDERAVVNLPAQANDIYIFD